MMNRTRKNLICRFHTMNARIFIFPLPDPIWISHGTTISFDLDGEVPHLRGVLVSPTAGRPPIPGSDSGALFTSLKFWQVRCLENRQPQRTQAVQKVKTAIVGGTLRAESDLEESTLTVVEMVIPEIPDSIDGPSQLFWKGLQCVIDVVDAYRVAENAKIARLSYERLDPFVMTFTRTLFKPYRWDSPQFLELERPASPYEDESFLDNERTLNMLYHLRNLRVKHPFSAWGELARDCATSFSIDGDYRRTVILLGLWTETLVKSVLACALWEPTFPHSASEDQLRSAARVLSLDPKPMRAALGQLLGGNWDPNGMTASGTWQEKGAKLRNKVVHEGYRVGRDEAGEAYAASLGLDTYIRERLIAQIRKFPRTAAMLIGLEELERRGILNQPLRETLTPDRSDTEWVTSYLDWRHHVRAIARPQ